jgi:hypothetical protein
MATIHTRENIKVKVTDILVAIRLAHVILTGAMIMLASCTYLPPVPASSVESGQRGGERPMAQGG